MSDTNGGQQKSSPDAGADEPGSTPAPEIEQSLAELEDAADRLRRVPNLPLVPELPFDPAWRGAS